MERAEYKTVIYAPKDKVWRVLWGENTYPVWTSIFSEGSRAETDWKEGSKVYFLNEKNEGMVSRIAKKTDNEFMSFEHIGILDENGREDLESEKVKSWAGAFENYVLKETDGKTELKVEMDVEDSYKDYFHDTFPKALRRVKELSEEKSLPQKKIL